MAATGTIIVLECSGGFDKGPDGHRRDTGPLCAALQEKGWSAEPCFYSDADYDAVLRKLESSTGVIARITPGTYRGVTKSKLDNLLRTVGSTGVTVMDPLEVTEQICSRNSIFKLRELSCALSDTQAYFDPESFKAGFPKSIATGPRTLRQKDADLGEGDWVCQLKNEADAAAVSGGTVVKLQDMCDNHREEKSLDDFMAECEQYLGSDGGGLLLDQQYLPRILEGEVYVHMVVDKPTAVVHKKPALPGTIANAASGSKYVRYKPDDPQFAGLIDSFVNKDLPKFMKALGLKDRQLPLIWTANFILGPKTEDRGDTYVICDLNCACVGLTQTLELCPQVAEAAIKLCSVNSSLD
mmetsp:Transcript_28619/g.80616  ORF Transcript_28619/g.80616 Transcript_28619/m.80616 type:complete len:354 (+) Transcript_28619:201-1262(+)